MLCTGFLVDLGNSLIAVDALYSVGKGIETRDSLIEIYEYIKENYRLPEDVIPIIHHQNISRKLASKSSLLISQITSASGQSPIITPPNFVN